MSTKAIQKIKSLHKQAIVSGGLLLMSLPAWAYEEGASGEAGAFDKMVKFIMNILGGSGGFVLVLLAVAGAAVGMISGNSKLLWSMVGIIALLTVGIASVKLLFGATF